MKSIIKLSSGWVHRVTAGVMAFAISAITLPAASPTFSGTGTTLSNSLVAVSYYVVPASGNFQGGGIPRVQYINVTGDRASSQVQFYKVVAQANLTGTPSAVTNVLPVSLTASATAKVYSNAVCVIWNRAADTYQRLSITNNTSALVSVRENTTNALAGDTLFVMAADAVLPVGVAVKEFGVGQDGIYSGPQGLPILMECNAGSNAPINCVSGFFDNRLSR